jgi:hypothetical protein
MTGNTKRDLIACCAALGLVVWTFANHTGMDTFDAAFLGVFTGCAIYALFKTILLQFDKSLAEHLAKPQIQS